MSSAGWQVSTLSAGSAASIPAGGTYAEMWALQQQEEEAGRGGTPSKRELAVAAVR
ncbi:MAG: hypothetical protein HYU73_28095 [Betaproteobacteria bacterium]|nr:hypothetical protein [Betaproteobacteria bacterium]